MAAVSNSILLRFAVSGIPHTGDADVRINIKKRRINIVYRSLTNDDNVNIAHLISTETTPEDNLFISNRSRSIIQNTLLNEDVDYTEISTQVFTVKTKEFLVSNIYTTDTPTQPSLPLFYKHTLTYFNPDLDDFSNRELLSVEFADYQLNSISLSDYSISESLGEVYNNITNNYNSETDNLDVKYVKYSVKVTTGSTETVSSYHELIDNEPIFHQAEIADLDDWSNLLITSFAYLLDELPNYSGYRITLPTSGTYAYKEIEGSTISILSPVAPSIEEPWNVRLTNGEFISPIKVGDTTYTDFKYRLAEFSTQLFSPYMPYKFIRSEYATRVYDNLIKVSRNIYINEETGLHVDVYVYDSSGGSVEAAYTSDPDKLNTEYNSSVDYESASSIDRVNGFIEVVNRIPIDRKVLVDYYTESNEYDFTNIDFNPISNRDIIDKRISIYITPESVVTGELNKTIQYLEVDKIGRITYCSQAAAGDGAIDPGTTKLLSEDFYPDGSPRHDFYYDKQSTPSGLMWLPSGVYSVFSDEFSFVDKYTTETVYANWMTESGTPTMSGYPTLSGAYLANMQVNPQFLLLGDIYVGDNIGPDQITEIDTRVFGGGIKEANIEDAKKEQAETLWYWDTEYPYPGELSFVVEVPQSILTVNGGDFTKEEITNIANKHAMYGTHQYVRTYGNVDPIIVSGAAGILLLSGITISGIVALQWPSYGDIVTYDVYGSTDLNGVYNRVNDDTINDVAPMNEFSTSGLAASTTYYFYVEATKNNETSKGPVVTLTTQYII